MISGPEFLSGSKIENLVILLHGWGSSGANFVYLARQMGKSISNTKFSAPNAPIKYGEDGYQWFELDDRSEDVLWNKIQFAAFKVNEFIDEKLKEFSLTEENLVLVGFSQGAMLSIHVSLSRLRKCAAVIAYSGSVVAPLRLQEKINARPPICIIHGMNDNVVPFSAMKNTVDFLKSNNITVSANPIAGLNHTINDLGMTIGIDFIQSNLTKK